MVAAFTGVGSPDKLHVSTVQSFTADLEKFTREHSKMKCYGLGLGLNTFKMVALTEHFRKLELPHLLNAYTRCERRLHVTPHPRRHHQTVALLGVSDRELVRACSRCVHMQTRLQAGLTHPILSCREHGLVSSDQTIEFPMYRSAKRLFLLDYDGTLLPQSSISTKPGKEVLDILRGLTADPKNDVFIISGRGRADLGDWFSSVVRLL